ncbi:MAG: sugar phosphate isomerase/epimerase [Candidatus Omnitrophota bacterium]|jgi:sugar phosphate isomerase/epimerase
MGFALSTSWNAWRCSNAKELLFEIKNTGFSELELSFNLTPLMVEEIEQLAPANQMKVSSLHNFCPIPDGIGRAEALPDYYSLSSPNQEERKLAVKQTKKTIDTARRLHARAVVLHCGRVEIPDKTRDLIGLYNQGLKNSPKFIRIKDLAIEERKDTAQVFLENAMRSLEELSLYAQKTEISLGVETRFYYREIPSFQEVGLILEAFRGAGIYYWHDTGHAQVMENLGLSKHREYLEAYAKDLLGIHLHGVRGCQDHQAPAKGEFDFSQLKGYLKKDTLKVIEAHHPATASDLKEAGNFLEKELNGRA